MDISKLDRRQSQLFYSDLLASELIGKSVKIDRVKAGRPHLVGSNNNISISHTGDWMSLIVNKNNPVAIDIERIERQVRKVKFKFTSELELKNVREVFTPNPEIFIWSCKECLFKILPFEGILFKDQLLFDSLIEYNEKEGLVTRWKVTHNQFNGFYKINSFIFEGLLISYIDDNGEVSTKKI